MRILVASPDSALAASAAGILGEHYEVDVVSDPAAALELAGRRAPDLVLMARMAADGLDLLRGLRAGASTHEVPVVLLSELHDEAWRLRGLELGADDYVITPIQANELRARVSLRLQMARLRAGAPPPAGELRIRDFLRQSYDGIIIIDRWGTILEWNEGEERLTGVPRLEAVGRPIWEIQHRLAPKERRNADFLRVARERTLSGLKEGTHLRRILEEEIERADGSRRTIQSVLFAMGSDRNQLAVGICRDLTERERAEERLRLSEERLSLALEAADLGLWDWDIANDTAYLSPGYLRLAGGSDAEVRPALAFFHGTVHPDDLPAVEKTMEAHFRGETPRSIVEYRMKGKSGAYAWIRGVGQITSRDAGGGPLRMTGVIADITEKRQVEEELRERQALLLEAERLAHLGHWDRDLRSGRSYWSDEVYRVLGYAPGSVPPARETFLQAVLPEDRERIDEAIRTTVRDGIMRRAEYHVVGAQGTVRTLIGTVELLRDATGAPARVIGTVQDITERKAAESERERLLEALRETDSRKNAFLAMLSHELRNPLAPIRNSLYILSRATPGGEQARRAQAVIDRQVGHMTRLIGDLLDVTRISRGKVQLQRERLDLCELVRGTVEDHRGGFVEGGIALDVSMDPAEVWVDGDRTRLAQAVGNLLQNALKFTPRGGRTTVSVHADAAREQAIVRVQDTGRGISAEILPRLFEAFTQVDATLDRKLGGLGLGLAIVKGLVEMHGGSVSGASEGAGKGATITLALPLEREVPAEPIRRHPLARGIARRARRVLVVEDNVDAAESLREVLELGGHQVDVAYDGVEGIEKARSFAPEVVLCDIGLPEMDGYEVARTLRADPELQRVRLVALTGYAGADEVTKAKEAGFDAHLAKPTSQEALDEMLSAPPSGG